MTSTPFNVGLTDNTRLSSRVLRPPGGGHTDIFGGEAEQPRGRRPAPSVLAAAAAQAEEAAKATNATNGTAEPAQPAPASPPAPTSPVAPPTPEAQNGQHTPDAKPEPAQPQTPPEPKVDKIDSPRKPEIQAEPAKVEPPRRVRVPPGGFSSGLW